MGIVVEFTAPPKLPKGQRPKRAVFGLAAPRTDAEQVAELDAVAFLGEDVAEDDFKVVGPITQAVADYLAEFPEQGEPKVPA